MFLLCFAFVFVSVTSTYANEPEWYQKVKQIKLMTSTRHEVESLFNNPKFEETSKKNWSQKVYYQLEFGQMIVSYSTGKCSKERNMSGYDVVEDTVIRVILNLKKPINMIELDVDLSNFEKYKERDNDAWIYTNEDLGIQLTGSEKVIRDLEFFPWSKYEYLSCRSVLQQK